MDETLLQLLNQTLAGPLLDAAMPWVGQVGLALCPALAAVLWFGGQRTGDGRARRVGLALLAGLAAGLALVLALQYLALRPRPEAVRLVVPAPNFPSFPSGHAMAVFTTATILGLAFGRPAGAPALAAAALVALSRVYLGHHYPSDVVAGGVLGAGVGAAAYGLMVESGTGRCAVWRWLLWPQLALVIAITLLAYLGYLPFWLLRVEGLDVALHFTLFGLVALWLYPWLAAGRRRLPLSPAALAVLVPFTAAALEEGAQWFSPLRTASWLDLGADLAGMCVGVLISQRLGKRRQP
jgi:undecaprenyl-diphosphatase